MSRHCLLVLHAHVPWVRHPEVEQCLEEDWLHSTLLETHLPLLEMLYRLREEEVPWRITLNLSPTLLAMLQDGLLKKRTLHYLERTLRLCRDEEERVDISGLRKLASHYGDRFERLRELLSDRWHGDLTRAYCDLRDSGHLELTASAATHGVLPLLMRVPEAVQAQTRAGIRQFVQCFGRLPRGFWLPECAYAPALSRILKQEGIEWTIVEEHALTGAPESDESFPFLPGATPEGLVVFARDQTSSSEVWSADQGYPGDGRYRDFLRDVGLEAPIEYLADFLGGSEQRQFTGIKYYRSSRNGGGSRIYDPELASKAVEEHSTRFVNSRGAQLAALEARGVEDPVAVCAFDADLFGHWWYEGTSFLESVLRKTADREDFSFTTPGAWLAAHPDRELPRVSPVSSSWGEGGYFEIWTGPENNWILHEIQTRGEQLVHILHLFQANKSSFDEGTVAHRQRCIRLMTRELLLAQSSDWGFLMKNEPSRAYAESRTRQHFENFDRIREAVAGSNGSEELDEIEVRNPIFNDLPWNLYEPCS